MNNVLGAVLYQCPKDMAGIVRFGKGIYGANEYNFALFVRSCIKHMNYQARATRAELLQLTKEYAAACDESWTLQYLLFGSVRGNNIMRLLDINNEELLEIAGAQREKRYPELKEALSGITVEASLPSCDVGLS